MFKPKILFAALLVLLILVFVVQNSEVVAVRLFFWEFEMSRVILILLASAAGFACGYVVARLTGSRSPGP